MSSPDEAALEQAVQAFVQAMTVAGVSKDTQQVVLVSAVDDATITEKFLKLYVAAAVVGARRALLDESNDTDDVSFAQLMRSKRDAIKNAEKAIEEWSVVVGLCDGLEGATAWFADRYGA